MSDREARPGRTRLRRITGRLADRRPLRRELEIRESDAAVGAAVGKLVGLALDSCISHGAAHRPCDDGPDPISKRIPSDRTDEAPDASLPELEEITGPMVVDCPAAGTKHDGEVVVVLRSPYDGCHVSAGAVVRVVAGQPHSANGPHHPVTAAPDLVDIGDHQISVLLAQDTGAAAEHPAHGLYLGAVRGTNDQGQGLDARHVVIYVHGVALH